MSTHVLGNPEALDKESRTILVAMLVNCKEYHATGSRYICEPAPATDHDVVCWVEDLEKFVGQANDIGYEGGGSPLDESHFVSQRRGEVNLIVTEEERFYRLFVLATNLAKRWNLTDKDDRIRLFQAILYGKDWDDEKQKKQDEREAAREAKAKAKGDYYGITQA